MLTNAAKQSVPRGYQKNWDGGRRRLYEHHTAATSSEGSEATANILIKRLDEERQERWVETVGSVGFTRSGRGAWHTVDRRTGRTAPKPNGCPVGADAAASRLLRVGRLSTQTVTFQAKLERKYPSYGRLIVTM